MTAMHQQLQLLQAKVYHKRLLPKVNQFTYRLYYWMLPLKQLEFFSDSTRSNNKANFPVAINRSGLTSFWKRDHGDHEDNNLSGWLNQQLSEADFKYPVSHVLLVCMPRVLGYVFNPVSFWLCLDDEGDVRAVLCEVNNTFGEKHSYLCAHPDHRKMTSHDWFKADKTFHVSPFLERNGHYEFQFKLQEDFFGVWINYFNQQGEKNLVTSIVGHTSPLTRMSNLKAFIMHPLVTLKAMSLIHWQALKLLLKGINFIKKPLQTTARLGVATSEFRVRPRG